MTDPTLDDSCNCQAVPGTAVYPGPWHPAGDTPSCPTPTPDMRTTPGGFPYRQHPHEYAGSNADRQSIGDPGHCEDCCSVGHVGAHPDLGCSDVGCDRAHPEPPAGGHPWRAKIEEFVASYPTPTPDTAAPARLEFCRACRDERDEVVPAEFIIWGKLVEPEFLGPRCWDHTEKLVGRDMHRIDQWAIFDLRPLIANDYAFPAGAEAHAEAYRRGYEAALNELTMTTTPTPDTAAPASHTIKVAWAPSAIQAAVNRASTILAGEQREAYRVGDHILTAMDLACLADAGRQFLVDDATHDLSPGSGAAALTDDIDPLVPITTPTPSTEPVVVVNDPRWLVDALWDSLNESTNQGTDPYTYADLERAVRDVVHDARRLAAAPSPRRIDDWVWEERIPSTARDGYRQQACRVLTAALGGRVVVDLPEPDGRDGYQTVWIVTEARRDRDVVARAGTVQDTYRLYQSPADAQEHGLRLLAAAREARRLADTTPDTP